MQVVRPEAMQKCLLVIPKGYAPSLPISHLGAASSLPRKQNGSSHRPLSQSSGFTAIGILRKCCDGIISRVYELVWANKARGIPAASLCKPSSFSLLRLYNNIINMIHIHAGQGLRYKPVMERDETPDFHFCSS